MVKIEVTCIHKSNRTSPHERITHIGGVNSSGVKWKLTQEEAIKYIEQKTREFYVTKNGKTATLIVSVSSLGNKYLKTTNDSTLVDNLLSLPECSR